MYAQKVVHNSHNIAALFDAKVHRVLQSPRHWRVYWRLLPVRWLCPVQQKSAWKSIHQTLSSTNWGWPPNCIMLILVLSFSLSFITSTDFFFRLILSTVQYISCMCIYVCHLFFLTKEIFVIGWHLHTNKKTSIINYCSFYSLGTFITANTV